VKEDGEIALTKRRVTKKYCPPDGNALKTYMELNAERRLEEWSDEELEAERQRLLGELKNGVASKAADDKNKGDEYDRI